MGRSRDALGALWDAPRTASGWLGTAMARQLLAEPSSHRIGFVFSEIFRSFFVGFADRFSVVFPSIFRSFFDRFATVFRSKSLPRVVRAVIAEHRFLCAWPVFRKVFSNSCVFERSKNDERSDRKSIATLIDATSQNRQKIGRKIARRHDRTDDRKKPRKTGRSASKIEVQGAPGHARMASWGGKTTSDGPGSNE